MLKEMIREYHELLVTIPLDEAFDWMDDCRSIEVKLKEMRRKYGVCTSQDTQR